MRYITTSWDDGFPADERIADLLDKYNLSATFYIPRENSENVVMSEGEIQSLSQRFEIGGHTLHHKRIHSQSERLFKEEIGGCFNWLTDLLKNEPVSFCFPGGIYNRKAVEYVLKTGFKIIRTTELLNITSTPNAIINTTLQIYNHATLTYLKHLLKRKKFGSIRLYMKVKGSDDLLKLVDFYLNHVIQNGGCFHIWGHSWEIEANSLWFDLERIFKMISKISECTYVSNAGLLNYKTSH